MMKRSATIIAAAVLAATVIMIAAGSGCFGGKNATVSTAAERTGPAAEEAVYVAVSLGDDKYALLINGVARPLSGDEPMPASIYVHNGDVYVAGSEGSSPQLWKNGERTIRDAGAGAMLTAVRVHNGDVYAAINILGDIVTTGVMKNDEIVYLIGIDLEPDDDTDDGTVSGFTHNSNELSISQDMHVSNGGDVYLAGSVRIFTGGRGDNIISKAALWRNGVPRPLAGGDSGAAAASVYTAGRDVYVAGQVTDNTPTGKSGIAALWKNGRLTRLSDSASVATSVFVSGRDVYVAGTVMSSGLSGATKAVLWKNGVMQTLSDSVSSAKSVYVYGGDVYVAGDIENMAALWKNGVARILGGDGSFAYSVHVGAGGNWKPAGDAKSAKKAGAPAASAGTGGEAWARGSQFNPNVEYGLITDSRDGQTYRTVTIGNLTWMAENLNYNARDSECYENRNANCAKYGRLYTWNTAKAVCPDGWRLPDTADWGDLMLAAGGVFEEGDYGLAMWRGAGARLKSRIGWTYSDGKPANHGTDRYGFSALPGGSRLNYGHGFDFGGTHGYWWTATDGGRGVGGALSRTMGSTQDYVTRGSSERDRGLSVRCVRKAD